MKEFLVPLSTEDLIKCSPSHYFVSSICAVNNLGSKIKDCRHALQSQGYIYIHAAFDYLFSAFYNWPNVVPVVKEDVWAITLKGCARICQELSNVLENRDIDKREKFNIRNAIKKSIYLLCQLMEVLVTDLSDAGAIVKGKGKGKKKKGDPKNLASIQMDLLAESQNTLEILAELLKLPLERMWEPPSLEEDFINCIADCCYKTMEDPSIAKSPDHRNHMTDILHSLIRRHNYANNCSAKLCQQLQCCAHLPPCILAIVNGLMDRDKANVTVVQSFLKEICSFSGDELERDSQVAKNFSQLLQEFAGQHPHIVISILPFLKNRLEEDPVTMRNCALTVIGEVILKVYIPKFGSNVNEPNPMGDNEFLNEKETIQREKLLDLLQDHIHDINGMVRAKTLSIWLHIIEAGSLPISRLSQLVELLVGQDGAIMDTSCQARKYAIRILTLMICRNVAGKISHEQLKQSYEEEKKRLDDLEAAQDPKFLEFERNWPNVMNKIHKALFKMTTNPPDDNEEIISESSTPAQIAHEIHTLLHAEQYIKAIQLFTLAQDAFPNDPLFCDINPPPDCEASSSNDNTSEEALHRKMVIWVMKLQDIYLAIGQHEGDLPGTQSQSENHQELEALRRVVRYLYESMRFAEIVQCAIPSVKLMLGSRTNSDILEAIEFFVLGELEGLDNMHEGIQRMLGLIWSKEKCIREAVVDAYKRIYLTNAANMATLSAEHQQLNEREKQQQFCNNVFKNLSNLMSHATLGDITSMQELLGTLCESGDLPVKEFVPYLIARFRKRIRGTTPTESLMALILISMISTKASSVVCNHVDELISEGLSLGRDDNFTRMSDASAFVSSCTSQSKQPVNDDLRVVRYTAICLQRIYPNTVKKGNNEVPSRFPQDHVIFRRLSIILRKTFPWCEDDEWISMMEEAINTIYKLAEHPDFICRDIILELSKQLLQEDRDISVNHTPINTPMRFTQLGDQFVGIPIILLARFLAVGGHVSIKQLIHLDVAIKNELKRRHELTEKNNSRNQAKPKNSNSKKSKKRNQSALSKSGLEITVQDDCENDASKAATEANLDEEMGLAGVTADDAEAEFIHRLCEQGLVIEIDDDEVEKRRTAALQAYQHDPTDCHAVNSELLSPTQPSAACRSQRLLCIMGELTCKVCEEVTLHHYPGLQSAASLALAKHMLVSSVFCEQRISLLLTLAERSVHETVRANLIVALGDLCRRFPNQMEPWTPNIYGRLRDPSSRVRINALNTLSHLILNDMIKVKGQISEMTTCIVDEEERIVQLSKMFFQELSQKGTAFYNVIPDIISRLSDEAHGVEEEKFQRIMGFLFPYIQKEKVCENLVEKLCQRLKDTTSPRLWRNLSFCLTLLNFNDKMVQNLFEGLRYFIHTLHVKEVYDNYMTVLANCTKTIKGAAGEVLKDLETQINKAHEVGVADEEAVQNAKKAANLAKRKIQANKRLSSQRRINQTQEEREESAGEEEENTEQQPSSSRRRHTRTTKASAVQSSSSKKRHVKSVAFSSDED